MIVKTVLFFLALWISEVSYAQIAGCTDPQANNFNNEATVNDGSCNYPATVHNPQFAFELSNAISETSGLAFFNEKLWTFNDSGGAAILYAIDTTTSLIVQQISISNAYNIDWEDITIDEDYVYIGDFGNNSGTRTDLVVYKVSREAIPAVGNVSVTAEKIYFSYPDQIIFERSKNHNFDCEAMVSAGEHLYLFSKNRGDDKTKLYRIPKTPKTYVANLLDEFNSYGLITGADYNQETNEVILTGYTQKTYTAFLWILFDFDGTVFFSGNKRRIELVNLFTTQIEGITYFTGKEAFISSEKSQSFSARVFRFSTAKWTDHVSFNVDVKPSSKKKLLVINNPVQNNLLKIVTDESLKGKFRIDLTDSLGSLIFQDYVTCGNGENSFIEIDITGYKPGVYNFTLFTNRRSFTVPFIQP